MKSGNRGVGGGNSLLARGNLSSKPTDRNQRLSAAFASEKYLQRALESRTASHIGNKLYPGRINWDESMFTKIGLSDVVHPGFELVNLPSASGVLVSGIYNYPQLIILYPEYVDTQRFHYWESKRTRILVFFSANNQQDNFDFYLSLLL